MLEDEWKIQKSVTTRQFFAVSVVDSTQILYNYPAGTLERRLENTDIEQYALACYNYSVR